MAFKTIICSECREPNHFYQEQSIAPPCPKCGYPKLFKTSEQYLKSMGVEVKPKTS